MTFFCTIIVAFSMFSAIPMPQIQWTPKNMRYALCAFPLVGAAVGLALWGWSALCGWLGAPALLRGAGLCLLPVLITGGIHLDGFADTCDALHSWQAPEKRRAILSDPHLGAFGAIRLCGWFIGYFGLCCAVAADGRSLLCWGLSFLLSRALSGLAVAWFPLAKDTGLAHSFASAADKKPVRRVLLAMALLLALSMCAARPLGGALMLLACGGVFLYYKPMAREKFGGLTGDLAGWFLQTAELFMLGALVFSQLLEAKL